MSEMGSSRCKVRLGVGGLDCKCSHLFLSSEIFFLSRIDRPSHADTTVDPPHASTSIRRPHHSAQYSVLDVNTDSDCLTPTAPRVSLVQPPTLRYVRYMREQPLEIAREGRALFPLTLVRAGTANPQPLIELPP